MKPNRLVGSLLAIFLTSFSASVTTQSPIGREVSVPVHLVDGQEFAMPLDRLIAHGRHLFTAVWTVQEGGGRPDTKGTGAPLADSASPLAFPRNFNRISGPDSNACAGCHNAPFGIPGGGGDIVANVFVLGQRFDFATFDPVDALPTRGAVDEAAVPVTMQTIANSRNTLGMFGSGFIEMLARQITVDLRSTRDSLAPGQSAALVSKGISFGTLARDAAGRWIASGVRGLSPKSLVADGSTAPPSLVVRPFHQAGAVVSLREFSNNAFNHHHGIQSTERFGDDTDPDGDGFTNELTRADVTAVAVFQATMAVPGRVIPRDGEIEAAIWTGEQRFASIGCTTCHIPALPLTDRGWIYSEPNPFNPPGNVSTGPSLPVDLTDSRLPGPRLRAVNGVVMVPAYTDLKLHDITSGPSDPNREALDMQFAPGTKAFVAGNSRFVTRKLWGAANEPPFFHHGMYTTLRQAVLAHAGEAAASAAAFGALPSFEQDCVIEFLKSLQVLPPGTRYLVIDERGDDREWPPRREN